ncbi:MAG: SRPBCC family protein [Alphaproteobacteria bacterium]|nr:SRPBCC family protein [Alphaproteobacteria bacterium]
MCVSALAFTDASASHAVAASLTRSVDVRATPAAVWSMIGPFCAIKDWLPPVGTCADDGKTPPTRTLVTKDGKATFVELQTRRDDARHSYSYAFVSSPLPVTDYNSTIKVTALRNGMARVTWTGTYVPALGKEKDAKDALSGIYQSGLDEIKAKFAKP